MPRQFDVEYVRSFMTIGRETTEPWGIENLITTTQTTTITLVALEYRFWVYKCCIIQCVRDERQRSNLAARCGGDCIDCPADPELPLRLLARFGWGNGRRNRDEWSVDDVLCRSIEAADARSLRQDTDVRSTPASTLSSENRLLLDRSLPWLADDVRPPESGFELNVTNKLFDERRCTVDGCSNSGVVCVDETTTSDPAEVLEHSAAVTGVTALCWWSSATWTRSTFCCWSL